MLNPTFCDNQSDSLGAKMDRTYTVTGSWQFPTDMLRRDNARAATPADQELIDRMSGEYADAVIGTAKVSIHLVMEAGEKTRTQPYGQFCPYTKRWESFGWIVTGDAEIDAERQYEAAMVLRQRLRETALAKLTKEERDILGLC